MIAAVSVCCSSTGELICNVRSAWKENSVHVSLFVNWDT
jgi:hypothetical protein